MEIDFLDGTNKGQSIAVDCRETVNWYPEITDIITLGWFRKPVDSAKNKIVLYPTPGLKIFQKYVETIQPYYDVTSYWPGDDNSNDVVGGATASWHYAGQESYVPGYVNDCFSNSNIITGSFTLTVPYITYPKAFNFQPTDKFSFTCWFKLVSASSDWIQIIGRGNMEWGVTRDNNGSLYINYWEAKTAGKIVDTNWHFIEYKYDNGSVVVNLDSINIFAEAGHPIPAGSSTRLGFLKSAANVQALLDEVKIISKKTRIVNLPTFVVTGNGTYRALFTTSKNRLFAVIGSGLYEINADITATLLGTLHSNSGMVSISENETQLMTVDNHDGWIFKYSDSSFNHVDDGNFIPGAHVVNIDGFFIVNRQNTTQFAWSNLRDGFTWDSLNYATAESTPGNIVSLGKINNELWIFKNDKTEVWGDTESTINGVVYPFTRLNNGIIDIGCAAAWSVATINNAIFWLGANQQGQGIIWMASGYQPTRISSFSEEYAISKMSTISDAVAFCYQKRGHTFYQITFPSANRTFVYDLTTQMWHERGYYNSATGLNDRHRAQVFAAWNGKNYVGDYQNANLYELDEETYTDNGNIIKRIRTGGHVHSDRKRMFFEEFEIDLERGVGLVTGQGNNPNAVLQWSDDGGFTWSNEYNGIIGKMGNYLARCHWHRLGMSRDRVFRLTISDPVKSVLIGARADISIEEG